MSDPFATVAIRQRVLAAWVAAPVRFREDANAEEDLALGGYRDRLVVELAQNAADAAARAGVPGRLALTLREQAGGGPVLVAANTGEPLTADGVQSLATLRASAKADDDDTVGRFGVGFAAVLAVSDEPAVISRGGGVRFSREDTAALVVQAGADAPELADELRRRGGHVPVLRLPFAAEGAPPDGFDTAVVLPLRDELAADAVREQLAALDDALLLALPSLAEVTTDADGVRRVLAGAAGRWDVHRRSGRWTDADRAVLLADRPTEERRQRGWQVLWAVPKQSGALVPTTLHAPTPTDEPLTLPALLLAGFPLDPTRRHVAPGPLTDRLVAECAEAYAGLLHDVATAGRDVLDLVPTGLPAGALDGALHHRVLAVLPGAEILHGVEGGLLRPRDAVALDLDVPPTVLRVLAPRVAGLVASSPGARAPLRALGVTTLPLADVVETLPAQGEPRQWLELYAGLAPLADDASAREALAAVPVPLVDGRVVRGARGLLLPETDAADTRVLQPLAQFGLRVVHPDAAHPLLARLGAVPATARAVLDDAAVRVAVEEAPESDDPEAIASAVLSLVAAAVASGDLVRAPAWLGDLPLPDAEGELAPAAALVLAGSPAERLLDPDEFGVLDETVARRWPSEALQAVGVLDGLAVVDVADVDLHDPPDEVADLDGLEEWADLLRRSDEVVDVVAVRDLDAVRPDAWPDALQHLAADPDRRRALLATVRHGAQRVPGYTAWWLRRELGLAGTVAPGGDDLDGLLRRAPDWVSRLDDAVRTTLGVIDVATGAAPPPELAQQLLDGLADVARPLSAARCLQLWRWLSGLAENAPAGEAAGGLAGVRVLDGTGSRVVEASSAVVIDEPKWLQRNDLGGFVVAPAARAEALADLLDLDLASERADGAVTSTGRVRSTPDPVHVVLPQAATQWTQHDPLTVDGHAVEWWVDDDGVPHASTDAGLARALAWAAERWHLRHALAEALAHPRDAPLLAIEEAAG